MGLPNHALSLYESLRNEVLQGSVCSQGLYVILYHGMLRGLQLLTEPSLYEEFQAEPKEKQRTPSLSVSMDSTLIRLLANMVLHLYPEGYHV